MDITKKVICTAVAVPLCFTSPALAGDSFGIQGLSITRNSSSSAQKALLNLLNNKSEQENLEILFRHLNTSDASAKLGTDAAPWRCGVEVPRGFRFSDNIGTVGMVLNVNAGFSTTAKIRLLKNGKEVGTTDVRLNVIEGRPTRNSGKPFSFAYLICEDLKTGKVVFQRTLVREFKNADPLNLHEFSLAGKKVYRTANSKAQTTILGSYGVLAGVNRSNAELVSKRTLPAAQKLPGAYSQVNDLLVTDPNADLNTTVVAGLDVATGEDENSWKQIKTQVRELIKDAFKKLSMELLKSAKEWLKSYAGNLVNALKSLVSDWFGWLKGIFG